MPNGYRALIRLYSFGLSLVMVWSLSELWFWSVLVVSGAGYRIGASAGLKSALDGAGARTIAHNSCINHDQRHTYIERPGSAPDRAMYYCVVWSVLFLPIINICVRIEPFSAINLLGSDSGIVRNLAWFNGLSYSTAPISITFAYRAGRPNGPGSAPAPGSIRRWRQRLESALYVVWSLVLVHYI
jgi:hypothetical protein